MDASAGIFALIGTVVGGGITIIGQFYADRRRGQFETAAHIRQLQVAAAAEQRQAVYELLDQVASDISALRSRANHGAEQVNQTYLEILEEAERILMFARERSLALVTKIANASLRNAARDVYEHWDRYIRAESNALLGSVEDPELEALAAKVSGADTALTTAARRYLDELDASAVGR
jgi:hypothetical protein